MSAEEPPSDDDPRRAGETRSGGAKKAGGAKKSAAKKGQKQAAAKKGQKQAAAKKSQKQAAAKKSQKQAAAKKSQKKSSSTKKAGKQQKGGRQKAAAKKATKKKAATKKAATKQPPAKKASAKKAARKEAGKGAGAKTPSVPPRPALPEPAAVERRWLASYPADVPDTYDYPAMAFTHLLDTAASDFPQAVATEFLGSTWTYAELRNHVDRFAAALRGFGVEKGDRVGLVLPNCPQHVVAAFGALRLGAVVVEHDPVASSEQLSAELMEAEPKVVVCLHATAGTVVGLTDSISELQQVVVTGLQDTVPVARRLLSPSGGTRAAALTRHAAPPDAERFTDLLERTPAMVGQAEIAPREDIALIVYAPAADGQSRGAMFTHFNLVASAFQTRLWLPEVRAGQEGVLCVVPFFRSYGFTAGLATGVLAAARLTLLPHFEPRLALKTIRKQRPTIFPGVPSMFTALSDASGTRAGDLSSLTVCLSATAPLPQTAADAFEQRSGARLRQVHAPLEGAGITHANPVVGSTKTGSVGVPVTDTVSALVGADDPTRPPAEGRGRLAVAGPQVMAGYWNRPQDTHKVLREGWALTDDVAEMDEDGYVTVIGGR